MSASRSLSVLLVLAVASCGKSDKPAKKDKPVRDQPVSTGVASADDIATAPRVTVGAFTVPLPSGWTQVTNPTADPGQVGLQTNRQPPVYMVLAPAPPMPFDPTEPAACEENGRKVPGIVGTASVIGLPVGKACVVQTDTPGKRSTIFIIKAGEQLVTATCQFTRSGDAGVCEPLIRAIALAP